MLRHRVIGVVPGRVGIADDVEPVPAPSLSIVGRREEALDQILERLRGIVGKEVLDLFGGRRQADQVVRGPSDEGPLGCLLDGLETLFLETREDEAVDRVPGPVLPVHRGERGIANRRERPRRPGLGEIERRRRGRRRAASRVGSPHLDPERELLDLLRRESVFLLRRHEKILILPAEGTDQEAFRGLSRHQNGAGVSAAPHPLPGVEVEFGLDLLRFDAVAGVALLDQDRTDVLLEVGDPLLVHRAGVVLGMSGGDDTRQKSDDADAARGDHAPSPWKSLCSLTQERIPFLAARIHFAPRVAVPGGSAPAFSGGPHPN